MRTVISLAVLALGAVAAWRATAPDFYRCRTCDHLHHQEIP